jgi:hypothetical protein
MQHASTVLNDPMFNNLDEKSKEGVRNALNKIYPNEAPHKSSWQSIKDWVNTNKSNPNVLIPTATTAFTAPLAAHALYKRYGERDLRNIEGKNEKMRNELDQLDSD